jgi:predicted  nucleic acid-binding Zn-ribbon protein
VREEERERMNKLEGERDTLMSALSDSKEMKGFLQDKCKAQAGEIAALRDRLAAAEAAGARSK